MRVEIKDRQTRWQYIEPYLILRYLIKEDDTLNTLIMCKTPETKLYTTDLALYEALCSIKLYDTFKLNKLVKFLESIDVTGYKKETGKDKPVVTHERVEELRKEALKN